MKLHMKQLIFITKKMNDITLKERNKKWIWNLNIPKVILQQLTLVQVLTNRLFSLHVPC